MTPPSRLRACVQLCHSVRGPAVPTPRPDRCAAPGNQPSNRHAYTSTIEGPRLLVQSSPSDGHRCSVTEIESIARSLASYSGHVVVTTYRPSIDGARHEYERLAQT